MDSDDSRDGSSGNETDDNSRRSPGSGKSRSKSQESNDSRSRSSTPHSRDRAKPREPSRSPDAQSNKTRSRSSSSSSDDSRSPSKPQTPKSPGSYSNKSDLAPQSPNSPRSINSPQNKSPNSSRSSSPRGSPNSPPSVHNKTPNSSRRSSVGSASGSPPRVATNEAQQMENEDNVSEKSASSRSSRKSRSSSRSSSSKGSRRKSEDGNSSDSSFSSVDSSSRKNKHITKTADTQPEEISDGDMESDNDKEEQPKKEETAPAPRHEINITHEDLSDVSDLEDSIGGNSDLEAEDRKNDDSIPVEDKENGGDKSKIPEKTTRPEDGEEQLDFEAEDGELGEIEAKENEETSKQDEKTAEEKKAEKEREELEEGEVTDEDDARPEETEPRPVCRFFSRGQCTWGASCRFLHPGVTDKGNYTMFEMIRLPGEFGMTRDERMYGKAEPPVVESAWERGLRTAKEMLRKSMKRKEQDTDFEEKKMNMSIAQEEFDKENGYYGRAAPSPEPRYVRHVPVDYQPPRPPPEEYYGRRQVVYEPEMHPPPPPRERVRSYRELPSHRMPDFYNNKYEEEPPVPLRQRKPKREVIVQRVEERQTVRADEWSDPWMRSKSPGRRKGRKRSYSSGSSSYSSSSSRSSSGSSKSSYKSPSSQPKRASRSHKGRHVSPSVIVSERKAANERAALMNPPAPKRRAPSPGMMRVSGAANPPAPLKEDQFGRNRSKLAVAAALARVKGRGKQRSSKSSSGSSSGSSSDSDSSESSSSSSKSNSPGPRRASEIVKAMDALKGSSLEKNKIKLNLKNPVSGVRKSDLSDVRKVEALVGKKRGATSPPSSDPKSKKATSRREELLKQLKAVEDAIAKKRSKVN